MQHNESESILKKARLAAGLDVADVARALNIRKKYIIALEEEKYHELPAKVYIRGYLRLYSEFLGVDLPGKPSAQHQISRISGLTRSIIDSPQLNTSKASIILLTLCALGLILIYSLYIH